MRKFGWASEAGPAQGRDPVLVAHGHGDAEHGAIMQDADDRVAFVDHAGRSEFLREPPELATAGDRRLVVEIHRMNIGALCP